MGVYQDIQAMTISLHIHGFPGSPWDEDIKDLYVRGTLWTNEQKLTWSVSAKN